MKNEKNLSPILLIEDNFDDFEATQRSFQKANLMNPIHWSKSASDGLDYLRREGSYAGDQDRETPCLVLMDLNMPGMDGRTALRKIKEDPVLKTIPVIVLTTSSSERDIEQCYQNGANTYIQKPVEFNKFLEALDVLGQYWIVIATLPPAA